MKKKYYQKNPCPKIKGLMFYYLKQMNCVHAVVLIVENNVLKEFMVIAEQSNREKKPFIYS